MTSRFFLHLRQSIYDVSRSGTYISEGRYGSSAATGAIITGASIAFNRDYNGGVTSNAESRRKSLRDVDDTDDTKAAKFLKDLDIEMGATALPYTSPYDVKLSTGPGRETGLSRNASISAKDKSNESLARTIHHGDCDDGFSEEGAENGGENIQLAPLNTLQFK